MGVRGSLSRERMGRGMKQTRADSFSPWDRDMMSHGLSLSLSKGLSNRADIARLHEAAVAHKVFCPEATV